MAPVKVNFTEVEENGDVLQLPNSPNHHLHLEQIIANNNNNNNDNNNNNNSLNEENYEPEDDDDEEEEEEEEKEEEDENKDDVNDHVVDNNAFISAEDVGNALFRLIGSIHLSDDPHQNNNNNNEIVRSQLSCSDESDEDENYEKDEFVLVSLSDIRKEVQCPICLGIIRKTRTVMECLHRFCRECIDKSIRMGNKECPACRTHCPSRRSLRDDANFDALIAALFPDIDQYEEEELSFQEDEEARNKQIQASIAQTLQRQTEALSKKRKRSQITYRRRRNYRAEDEVDAHGHDGGKYSSSKDEHTEAKSQRSKRRRGQRQPSPASVSGDGSDDEHDQEAHKEPFVASVGLVGCSETLAWGKGGLRSNTRYGSGAGGYAKHSRSRLAKLGHHLRNLHENDSELEIHVVLIPLDQQKPSAAHHSFICSRPSLSVEQLCQFIAFETSLAPERLEILAARGPSSKSGSFTPVQGQVSSLCALEACIDDLQVLDSEETLAGLRASCNFNQGHLRLAYRQKAST